MYDDRDDREWFENLKSGETWLRGAFVVLFLLVLWFVRLVLVLLAALQFGATLITGRPVALALPFARSLSSYVQEIALFVTYNSDRRPWPWSAWPDPGEGPEDSGYGPDEEDLPPEPKQPRKRTTPPPPVDEADETPPPPESEDDVGDAEESESEDDETPPPRSRKRKSSRYPDGADGAGSSGEPPRPDA